MSTPNGDEATAGTMDSERLSSLFETFEDDFRRMERGHGAVRTNSWTMDTGSLCTCQTEDEHTPEA